MQDATPLQGDCSPDSVTGVCETQKLNVTLKLDNTFSFMCFVEMVRDFHLHEDGSCPLD